VKIGLKVDYGIASIIFFRVDILLFSESVWFGAKTTRTQFNNKVELREALKPLHLPLGQYLGNRKVLKVFVIYKNINGRGWTLQVVLPNFKNLKNNK